MNDLRLSYFQYDIAWEDKPCNLSYVGQAMARLCGTSDLLVLPEMFSTGFSMHCDELAEPAEGETITALCRWAGQYGVAVAGSFIAVEKGAYYNRAFFLTPQGDRYFYDKRHLFRMGVEPEHFSPGNRQLLFSYKGWNLSLLICYDLRFPVWSRNVANKYDLLLYCANWPVARTDAWVSLLKARAIENCAYVAGVNRIGTDGNGVGHAGHSALFDYKGASLNAFSDAEQLITVSLSYERLQQFREKFPVWKDADSFTIKNARSQP
jgi:predicted amidohydrolase